MSYVPGGSVILHDLPSVDSAAGIVYSAGFLVTSPAYIASQSGSKPWGTDNTDNLPKGLGDGER